MKKGAARRPDQAKMQKAVRDFLSAAGLDAKTDPNLAQTAQLVTRAWTEEFLSGYSQSAKSALGELHVAPAAGASAELVVVTGLRFRSMCPHHLLPVEGRAHVAYIPQGSVVGFGRLAQLVDVFAHRLVLQEQLARDVAQALSDVLGTPGAACVLEARQACLRIRGTEQRDAITHAEAYEGVLANDPDLRRELWARIPKPQWETP